MDENKDNLNNEFGDSMFSSNENDSMFSNTDENSDSMFSADEDATSFDEINNESEEKEETSLFKEDNNSTENTEENDEKIIDVEEINKDEFSVESENKNFQNEEIQNAKSQKENMNLRFENVDESENPDDTMVTVRPVRFQEFSEPSLNLSIKKNLDIMQDVPMHITVELGRTKSTIKEIINMEIGSIVELDKIAGEQVEIFVNEKLIARGEVIVIEDKFGVRVVNTNIPKENF